MLVLEAPRVRLLAFTAADEDMYVGLYTDAEVMRHVGPPLEPGEARRAFAAVLRLASRPAAPARYWRIAWREGGRPDAGLIAMLVDADRQGAEIGLLLWPHSQDQGVAREAISAVADHAFSGEAPLSTLWTRHTEDNVLVDSLMRRLGFARDGEVETGTQRLRQPRWRTAREQWQRRTGGFARPMGRC